VVWPARLKDAEGNDVVEQQLLSSTHVDEDAKREVIANIEAIDEAAHQRTKGAERHMSDPRTSGSRCSR